MSVKKCPICGNEPLALCYTSYPAKYGYSHCNIHGGYNNDWREAETKWNEQVETYIQNEPKEREYGKA